MTMIAMMKLGPTDPGWKIWNAGRQQCVLYAEDYKFIKSALDIVGKKTEVSPYTKGSTTVAWQLAFDKSFETAVREALKSI